MLKTATAIVCLAALLAAAPPTSALPLDATPPAPHSTYTCPLGYDQNAFLNICVNANWQAPNQTAARTYCPVGTVCATTPILLNDGRVDTLIYAETLCNQPSFCDCGHLGEGLLFTCTPFQSCSGPVNGPPCPSSDGTGERRRNGGVGDDDLDCPVGYRTEGAVNVCLYTDPHPYLAPAVSGHSYCIVGGICALVPTVFSDRPFDPGSTPLEIPYVEVLCNQQQGCGCSAPTQGLLILCSPFQD